MPETYYFCPKLHWTPETCLNTHPQQSTIKRSTPRNASKAHFLSKSRNWITLWWSLFLLTVHHESTGLRLANNIIIHISIVPTLQLSTAHPKALNPKRASITNPTCARKVACTQTTHPAFRILRCTPHVCKGQMVQRKLATEVEVHHERHSTFIPE